ncbi:MAG: enoyl-CoA hydratase [bacterium]
MESFDRILYEKMPTGVAFVRINNPENRNALDVPLRKEMTRALETAAEDAAVRVIILCGVGDHFCAGGDIKSMGDFTSREARERIALAHKPIRLIQNLEKPVIAMVHGFAAGAGMNITLACDLIVAADDTRFIQGFVRIGLIPDVGGLYFLPRLIGIHRAKELVFSGGRLDAREAAELGLVNRVVPRQDLEKETLKLAESLAEGPGFVLGIMKKMMNKGLDCSLDTFLEMEAGLQALCFNSDENREGVQAFLEKRKPRF